MSKQKNTQADHSSNYEGRDRVFVDIDRMINEGLAGGSVFARHDSVNIEEARDLKKEQPPREAE